MSLNWTSVKSLAIPVGGTARDVKRVSIGGSVVWEKSSPLPYDAEVEYLESTGTQYIATGVYTTGPMTFRLSATFTPTWSENDFFGGYTAQKNGNVVCGIYGTFAFGFNNPNTRIDSAQLGSAEMYADIEYALGESSRTLTVNGTTYSGTGATYNTANEVLVFRANPAANGAMKLHAFKILDAQGNLVRDFVPVRVGTVGYLYDRVSGALFGNVGTGAFGYGGDLPYSIGG